MAVWWFWFDRSQTWEWAGLTLGLGGLMVVTGFSLDLELDLV